MPTTETVDLTGRTPRGQSASGGGCLMAFSVPFLAVGPGISWLVTRNPEGANAPLPVIYGFASLFSLAGLLVFAAGLKASLHRFRWNRLRRAHPDQPWRADYDWKERGDRDRPFSKAVSGLFGLAFFALFLAPFNWWMWHERHPFGILIVGLFDVFLVAGIGFWLYEIGRALKYGAGWIAYERFPFFLGERLEVRLGCRGRLDKFEKVVVTVRFIRERQTSGKSSSTTSCRQHWAERLEFDPRILRGASDLPISIELPTGEYGTRLSDTPARYWEVEMKGEAPGIDFESRFLVPVYSRR
jgi:hypothetical protein